MMSLHHRKIPPSLSPPHMIRNDNEYEVHVQYRKWPYNCRVFLVATVCAAAFAVGFSDVDSIAQHLVFLSSTSTASAAKLRKTSEVKLYYPNICQDLSQKDVSRPKLRALIQHIVRNCPGKEKEDETSLFYPGSTIPRIIHQQWRNYGEMTDEMKANVDTFKSNNQDSYHMMWEDADIDEFVQLFYPRDISSIFLTQLPLPVHRSDLFRYMVLQTFGGVYSDVDTVCLKPISSWIPTSSPKNQNSESSIDVGIIVGVEADVGDRPDWATFWARELQWCQWTMASSRNHEILSHVIHHIVSKFDEAKAQPSTLSLEDITAIHNVVHFTGPAVWTDSVNSYISSLDSHWTHFRSLQGYKKIKDLLALPITGFSPNVGHMGSQGIDHPEAKVEHKFLGSWRIKNSIN